MSDNIDIIVQDTINDIVVNSSTIVETIDIVVESSAEEVTIISNPNDYIININRVIGEQVNSDWNATTGKAEILNKPTIPSISGLATITYVDQQDALKVDKVAGSRLITSAESTLLGNTSGTNTGDETTATIKSKLGITTLSGSNTGDQDLSGLTPKTTTISTTTPLQGGGDLSANRTLSILQSNTSQSGFLSSTDWNTFNSAYQSKINSAAFSGTDIKTLTLNQQSGETITANFSIYDSMEIFYNVSTLQDRTIADGGTFEAKKCLFNQLSNLNNI